MRTTARLLTGGLFAASVLFTAACSDDGTTGPQMGTLEVNLTMTGVDVDANGGTFLLDGELVGPLFVNVKLSVDDIENGVYVIQVTGIATNCSILGANPRNVRIRASETSVEDFEYLCESTGGKDDSGDPKDPPAT